MATTVQTRVLPFGSRPPREQLRSSSQRRPEYLFIHTVRFWSIVAIVALHCGSKFVEYQAVSPWEAILLVQPFKFGTIGFFLISGFLVGDRLPASGKASYLRRRAHRLLPAWTLWFALDVLYVAHADLLHLRGTAFGLRAAVSILGTAAVRCFTGTALWFVPNFMLALTCVVLLRNWLNDLRLGAVLLAANIFYGINVYTRWLPSRHTEALFGFVFYLWLGAWCSLRKERIQSWAAAQSPWWLSFWACVAVSVSLIEMLILRALHSPDAFNSLRFGNQIYSVLIVILLLRIQRRSWPAFVNVAETTYGVYLIHWTIITLIFSAAKNVVTVQGQPFAVVLLMWLILTLACYFLSLQLTRIIASKTGWAWAVGAAGVNPGIRTIAFAARSKPLAQPSEA